ncbi:MAG: hypothetical protein QM765_28360 [Myxococcales bacterium]
MIEVRELADNIVVDALPDLFPSTKLDAAEAVYFFPKVLQGLGFLHLRFKQRSDAYSDERWSALAAKATVVTESRSWVDRIAHREHCAGRPIPPTAGQPVRHYLVETSEGSNHGRKWGVTELEGGGLVAWIEYW